MLLGTYLRDATDDHEIRRRHEIPLLAEDAAEHRYHARHLFGAYVQHLGESSPEVAVLRLLGFFDRPAEEKLLAVLREADEPELNALTAPLRNLSPADWRRVLRRLTELRLIDVPVSPSPPIDSHPHGAGRCSAPSGSSRRVAASIRGCRDRTSRESAGYPGSTRCRASDTAISRCPTQNARHGNVVLRLYQVQRPQPP